MGVNANFQGDFTTFNNAVDTAIVKLADFSKGASDVEKKLNDMVDKWSGRALIQQVNELVVVINKVGGVTALTTTEQQKLNATLQEGLAKYKAMGETVPADLQKMADETKALATASKTAKDSTGSMLDSLMSLAGAFGVAFSVQAVVQFFEKVVEGAQAMQTLSQQTRINVETLQTLTAATASYGITGDDLARALFNLQERIAGGDQSVVVAYARMGISLDELRNKSPEDLFLTTERALGKLQGTSQDLVAKELWSKLGVQMIGFSKDVDTAMESVSKIPKVSNDANKALADLGDAADRSKKGFMNWVSEGVGGALLGLQNLHKALDEQGGNQIKILAAAWMDWATTMVTWENHGEHLATVFDELNRKQATDIQLSNEGAKAHKDASEALITHAQAADFMAKLEGQATKPLLDWQVQYLDHLKEMNQLDALHASGIGVTAQQLDKYKAGLEAAKKASEDLKRAIAEQDAIAMETYNKQIRTLEAVTQANLKAYNFDGQIAQLEALKAKEEELARAVYAQLDSEKARMKVLDDLTAKRAAIDVQEQQLQQKQAQRVNEQVIAELDARTKVLASYGQQVDGTVKMQTAAEKYQRALDELHAHKKEGIDQYWQEAALEKTFIEDQDAEIASTIASTEAKKGKTAAIKTETQSVAELHGQLTMLYNDPKIAQYFGALDSGQASVARTLAAGGKYSPGEAAYIAGGGIISGPIGGGVNFRAAGGPVDAGAAYIVGERGPELFVPSSSGNVVANGGGGGVTINLHGAVLGTPTEIARVVGESMMALLRSQGTRLPIGASRS